MLDTTTKRRIDTCRDILVGKVPDPKSQVEQITIAMIYKFMDDMDTHAEELGGKRTFFAGVFQRFAWRKLLAPGVGGQETLNVYTEAITRMGENPGIPSLFRDIFKNAYLPYRDPETLRMFLKEVDGFEYDHSEKLGDAFEYLLSVLGSQGDAGQFRTPRHIIDFMVKIVDPTKGERVLDPACGTAGFLISAYKHVLGANTKERSGDKLTPDEKSKLADSYTGYDISPDMVRLSLVNMYLHGFLEPNIIEYDTLTSEDNWNQLADVILANPPFMSPRGGIKPHKRFSVQSNRSEVLFVDYMAEHLASNGRAGIIVPEGVIFQSGTAYKQLRKMLVEQYLVAVVSLPAGAFNPYSGVKCSILILDKSLARQSDSVGFFKVDNDGFSLGAQRRAIDKNDLPQVLAEIDEYMLRLRAKVSVAVEDFAPTRGLIVAKQNVAANGDFNLSGERYRENGTRDSSYPLRKLGELLEIQSGFPFKSERFDNEQGFPIIRIRDIKPSRTETKYIGDYDPAFVVHNGDLLIGMDGEFNCVIWQGGDALLNQRVCRLHSFRGCVRDYVARLIPLKLKEIEDGTYAVTVKHISVKQISAIEIPLPPLEVQKEIVAEIEGYQRVIDGARAVIDNYRPHIPINPAWPMVELGDVSEILRGITYTKSDQLDRPSADSLAVATTKAAQHDGIVVDDLYHIPRGTLKDDSKLLRHGDILISTANSLHLLGRTTHVRQDFERPTSFGAFMSVIRPSKKVLDVYLLACVRSDRAAEFYLRFAKTTTNISNLNTSELAHMPIPLPSLIEQEKIVAEIEAEQRMVEGNRQLIERMEQKIAATLARIWGENV